RRGRALVRHLARPPDRLRDHAGVWTTALVWPERRAGLALAVGDDDANRPYVSPGRVRSMGTDPARRVRPCVRTPRRGPGHSPISGLSRLTWGSTRLVSQRHQGHRIEMPGFRLPR